MLSNQLDLFQNIVFSLFTVITYILIVLSILNVYNASKYLNIIDYYVRIYVCLFLIYRFNPLRDKNTVYKLTELDRKIAFSAGVFLITTTALNTYIKYAKTQFDVVVKKVNNNSTVYDNGIPANDNGIPTNAYVSII